MEYPDFSDSFVTDVVFPSHKEMVNWVQQVGRGLGMIIVTGRSDLNTSGRTPRIFLECQRSDCWKIEVVFGRHNHSVAVQLEGHSYANRLRVEEKALVADLMKAGMRPKNTLKNLNENFPDNTSTVQTSYNFRKKNKVEVMAGCCFEKAPKNHVAPISTKEKYLPLVHKSFRQYVEDFEIVSGDGKCGFRVVAVGMGFDKEMGWIQVRQDLVEEIDTWRHDLYDKMWHDDGASKLRTSSIDNNHYVNVKLYQNCLFPRPVTSWRDFVFQGGGEWRDWALPRVDAYTEAFRNLQLLTDVGVEHYAIILSDIDDDDDDLM
ncbi:hypothetical protein IFM89_023058 [Coptis chinensis]|uniref:OTU domain-containing protein n=1 Tax=Coptis chinensis TaxID=261450 RepID=A0A835MAF2_9MAGN|nr:hypothetical protein IFM89_023058 [Coptis chinensis]